MTLPDLRFQRTSQGIVVDVLRIDGQLDVVADTDHENSQRKSKNK
jgi:hypothetical protein